MQADASKCSRNTIQSNLNTNTEYSLNNRRFTPPTIEEVEAYCLERRNGVDAQAFIDFYTANGWVQGKGKPIKNWQACIRLWERNRKPDQKEKFDARDFLKGDYIDI